MKFILIHEWLRFLALAQKHNPFPSPAAWPERPSRYSRFAGSVNVFRFDDVLHKFLIDNKIEHAVRTD